jgi:hypothetical protein
MNIATVTCEECDERHTFDASDSDPEDIGWSHDESGWYCQRCQEATAAYWAVECRTHVPAPKAEDLPGREHLVRGLR